MIEESYVSFDTARMLKEAGFEANLKTMYVEEEKDEWAFWDSGAKRSDYNYFDDTIACPTQALAARWLREVHNIHVFAFFDYVKRDWCYCIANLDAVTAGMGMDVSENNYPTYEQALEVALQEAIKLIKK